MQLPVWLHHRMHVFVHKTLNSMVCSERRMLGSANTCTNRICQAVSFGRPTARNRARVTAFDRLGFSSYYQGSLLRLSRSSTAVCASAVQCRSTMASVGIVGAGLSGLCMAIKLQKAGFHNFTIFEAADDIGGTWRANRYPGCACDVQSVMYCYSFEPYPWTQHYSEQQEILQYIHHCADKYQLWDNIRLNTRLTGAAYDEDRAVWRLTMAGGEEEEVQVLVLAQGPLSIPTVPSIPGLQDFSGATMHTAAWDSSIELAGKKVAVVGTGASALQAIPKLQQTARELVVFQRTPAWVLPRKELMPCWAVPAAQHGNRLTLWLQRAAVFWRNELLLGAALVKDNQKLLRKVEKLGVKHMQEAVHDPQLQKQLTPNFTIGCKRILASDDYYPALVAPNVQLVPAGLKQVKADGTTLEADNGEVICDVDVIIFATGFDVTAPLAQFDVRAHGATWEATLEGKPEAYYGMAVAGFPNLFTLLGPNTGLGHSSVLFMAECQIDLIIKLLRKHMLDKGAHWVEISAEAQHTLNQELQKRLLKTVWLRGGCKSWYTTSLCHSETNNSNSGKDSDSGKQGGGTVESEDGVVARVARAGDKQQAGSGGSGGSVMWPGLCAEFWWRTLWPVDRDWRAGRAASPPAAAAAAGTGGKQHSLCP